MRMPERRKSKEINVWSTTTRKHRMHSSRRSKENKLRKIRISVCVAHRLILDWNETFVTKVLKPHEWEFVRLLWREQRQHTKETEQLPMPIPLSMCVCEHTKRITFYRLVLEVVFDKEFVYLSVCVRAYVWVSQLWIADLVHRRARKQKRKRNTKCDRQRHRKEREMNILASQTRWRCNRQHRRPR